ncbi:MAG: glutathione S-transferase [Candidatus Azotimanducaceae bacterium]|jgi:glutathione S-transferase
MFMAELGVSCDVETIDIMGGENRKPEYLAQNPSGQSPALQLDDGTWLAEITVICEYFDDKSGHSDLIGTTAEARAETRMWMRRLDLQILEPLANGFRYSEGLPLFSDRLHCIPAAADDLKATAQERLTWLNTQIEGKQFICGDRFTLADIMLYVFLEFGVTVGQPLNEANTNVMALYGRVQGRDSASA